MVKSMSRRNKRTENSVVEKVLEGSNVDMIFDDDEIGTIKEIVGKNKDALGIVHDIVLARSDKKGFVMDVLEELLNNDFKEDNLIWLYEKCDKDIELLIWNVERERLEMLRREDL